MQESGRPQRPSSHIYEPRIDSKDLSVAQLEHLEHYQFFELDSRKVPHSPQMMSMCCRK